MQVEGPNDLIRFCYEYGLKEIPITKNGSIQFSISKKDLVRQLSSRDEHNRDIRAFIDEFAKSVESNFLKELKKKLQEGTISGIPVINHKGELKRTITPGVLRAEEESREFLDQAIQKELYETLFEQFPFPVKLKQDDSVVFSNFDNETIEDDQLTVQSWSVDNVSMEVYFPEVVLSLKEALDTLDSGKSIEMRELLDTIEETLLERAHHSTDSISEAAKKVDLPRQTFNYRWEKINDD